jgi:hypothetical protein
VAAEAGPAVDFDQQFGQVDFRKPPLDQLSQSTHDDVAVGLGDQLPVLQTALPRRGRGPRSAQRSSAALRAAHPHRRQYARTRWWRQPRRAVCGQHRPRWRSTGRGDRRQWPGDPLRSVEILAQLLKSDPPVHKNIDVIVVRL